MNNILAVIFSIPCACTACAQEFSLDSPPFPESKPYLETSQAGATILKVDSILQTDKLWPNVEKLVAAGKFDEAIQTVHAVVAKYNFQLVEKQLVLCAILDIMTARSQKTGQLADLPEFVDSVIAIAPQSFLSRKLRKDKKLILDKARQACRPAPPAQNPAG